MGMSNWILDSEEQFWDIAENTIGGCEVFEEFVAEMSKHKNLIIGSPSHCENDQEFESMLVDAWHEKWYAYV